MNRPSASAGRMPSLPPGTTVVRAGRTVASLVETCKLNGIDP